MELWIVVGAVIAVLLVIGGITDHKARRARGYVPRVGMPSRGNRLDQAASIKSQVPKDRRQHRDGMPE